MNNICYVAIPQAWESPKGVMMRTALHNGYRTVACMCYFLNIPYSWDGLELLTDLSPLVERLSMEAPFISLAFSNNAYTMSIADTAHWSIDKNTLYRTQFESYYKYCPICLSNEIISVYSDLSELNICPLHKINLITFCPNCKRRERWTKANLLFCKCGFDRRQTDHQYATFLEEDRLETFGPDSYIDTLSKKITLSITCDNIWQSRMPFGSKHDERLIEVTRKHAKTMIINQIKRFPGFPQSLHLAPWMLAHPLLSSIAENLITDSFQIDKRCIDGLCCKDVKIRHEELAYCMKHNNNNIPNNIFINRNFHTTGRGIGKIFYQCYTPLCNMVSYLDNKELELKIDNETNTHDYFTTSEAGTLLHCSSGHVIQLADIGYLTAVSINRKLGIEHSKLIHKKSVYSFNNEYILIGSIASELQASPIKVVQILNRLGIYSEHNKIAPYVYSATKIYRVWKELKTALSFPVSFCPIVLPPTKEIYNTMQMNGIPDEKIDQHSFHSSLAETGDDFRYTMKQAANLLDISGSLMRTRFIMTGLITPKIKDNKIYYSPTQIKTMKNHIKKYMSIEQVMKYWSCSRLKAAYVINLSAIQPATILAYSNGNRQVLYSSDDIFNLTELAESKADKSSIYYKVAIRKKNMQSSL